MRRSVWAFQSLHLLLGGGAAAVLAASPAVAQSFAIIAKGTVGSSCSVAVAAPFGAANFAVSGSVSATAIVNCNTGFTIKATSANGAAKNSRPATTGFINNEPYTLQMSVPTDSGMTLTSAVCASAQLLAGQSSCTLSPAGAGLSSAGKTAIGETATLTAAWIAPALPTRLVAGSYSDTITISIASAP